MDELKMFDNSRKLIMCTPPTVFVFAFRCLFVVTYNLYHRAEFFTYVFIKLVLVSSAVD